MALRVCTTSLLLGISASHPQSVVSFSSQVAPSKPHNYNYDAAGLTVGGADLEAYFKGHVARTKDFEPTAISLSGKEALPADFPTGTYFKNGPGSYEADDGLRYLHHFDCNGKIMAITLDPTKQQAVYRYKYVNTPKYQQDVASGTISERGFFGTRRAGGFWGNIFQGMDPKNPANTAIVLTDDQKSLYALWEAGRPFEMDPLTLETRGETFCGFLDSQTSFSAHPSYDPKRKTFTNFCIGRPQPGKETSTVTFQEIDSNTFQPVNTGATVELPGLIVTHDMVMTENYIVFNWIEAMVNVPNAFKALLGMLPPFALVENAPSDVARYLIIPRELLSSGATVEDVFNDERIKVVETPFHVAVHHTNAYEITTEDKKTRIVFEASCLVGRGHSYGIDEMVESGKSLWESFDWNGNDPVQLEQFELEVDSGNLVRMDTMATESIEFPVVNPECLMQQHNFVFMIGAHKPDFTTSGKGAISPFGSIRKVNLKTKEQDVFSFAPFEFVHDGDVVRKVGASPDDEDAVYFVSVVTNGKDLTSDLVILDGQDLAGGPVTQIRLPEIIPNNGLHGNFYEGANQFSFD